MPIEVIPIKTTKDKFFLQYLVLKRPVIDIILTKINGRKTMLHDNQMYVLAELLWLYDKYLQDDGSDSSRWEKVFNRESKMHIMKKLKMKEHLLNVYFSQLRKMKILNGKKINKPFIINAVDHNLSFNFVLNGNNGEQVDQESNTEDRGQSQEA